MTSTTLKQVNRIWSQTIVAQIAAPVSHGGRKLLGGFCWKNWRSLQYCSEPMGPHNDHMPNFPVVCASKTFGYSCTNDVLDRLASVIDLLSRRQTSPDHQVRSQSAGGQQWKNCVLGRKNGPSRSQSSAPWILRRSSVKSDVFNSPRWHALSKVFLSHNTLQLSHPSLPKLSSLTSFKWGLYRSSLTRAGMPFRYVICFQFRSFFMFSIFDWTGNIKF